MCFHRFYPVTRTWIILNTSGRIVMVFLMEQKSSRKRFVPITPAENIVYRKSLGNVWNLLFFTNHCLAKNNFQFTHKFVLFLCKWRKIVPDWIAGFICYCLTEADPCWLLSEFSPHNDTNKSVSWAAKSSSKSPPSGRHKITVVIESRNKIKINTLNGGPKG